MDSIKKMLNVKENETTEDLRYTLEPVACLGCCGLAPVMTVDNDVYGQVDDLRKVKGILDKYREKEEEAS